MNWSAIVLATAVLVQGGAGREPQPAALRTFPETLMARRLADPDRIWTEADLLPIVMAQGPDVLAAKAHRLTAVKLAKAARAAPLSGFSLSAEYANNAGSSPWLYGASLDLAADGGVRKSTRLTLSDLDRLQADQDLLNQLWAARSDLAKAISARRAADEAVQLSQRLSDARQAAVDLMEARVSAGEDARPLALAARVDLALAHRRVAEALARQGQANLDLAGVLGLSPTAVQGLKLAVPISPGESVNLPATLDVVTGRSDVLAAVIDYDRAEAALRLEVARQWPEIRFGPGYSWDHGVVKLPFNLALVLPPADLNRANIRAAEAKRQEAAKALEAVQAQVMTQVDRARESLGRARMQLAIIRDRDLPTAQGVVSVAMRALKAGEADRIDALTAQAAMIEVQLSEVEAQASLETAVVDLEAAVRTPTDPQDLKIIMAEMQSGTAK